MYRFHSGIIFNGPLEVNGDQGAAGEVLTSAGAGLPPTWGAGGGGTEDGVAAYLDAAAITTLTAGNPIIFDHEQSDPAGSYDNTTGIFTAANTGWYSINLCVHLFNNSGGPFAHQTQLRVNGNVITSQSTIFLSPVEYCSTCSMVLPLTAGDTVTAVLNETIGSGLGTGVAILNGLDTRLGIYYIQR